MQEDLEEAGSLNLKIPPTEEFSATMLIKHGFTRAVVTRNGTRLTLHDLYGRDVVGKYPRKLICIRENPNASLLLDGQLYQGDEACKRCANCLMCFTKNKFADFIINDGENPDPLGELI